MKRGPHHSFVDAMAWIIACLLLSACQTPQPVLDLAKRTAANTSQFAIELKTLSENHKKIWELRNRNIERMQELTNDVRQRHKHDEVKLDNFGDNKAKSAKAKLNKWSMLEGDIFPIKPKSVPKVDTKAVKPKPDPSASTVIDAKAKSLIVAAKAIAKLAKEDDFKTRAGFLFGYFKEVKKLVDEKRKASDAAASSADKTASKAMKAVEKSSKEAISKK